MIAYVQDGETALYIASRKRCRAVVELLLQMEHTDVDISTKVYYHYLRTYRLLMSSWADYKQCHALFSTKYVPAVTMPT